MHWRKWNDIAYTKQGGGMGFKDLHLFNLAMLGKQGWRLLTRPESLCARTLCGKYFHNSSFMTARKKRGSSHTWQARNFKGKRSFRKRPHQKSWRWKYNQYMEGSMDPQ